MTAQEQQPQRVVLTGGLPLVGQFQSGGVLLPTLSGSVAAPDVDEAPRGNSHQPARIIRYASLSPLQRRGQQSLLYGVLARVELTVPPYQPA